MNSFVTRIYCEPSGSGYSAYSPEVPAVVATGSTVADAERNMRYALAKHFRTSWQRARAPKALFNTPQIDGDVDLVAIVLWSASKVMRRTHPADRDAVRIAVVKATRKGRPKR